MRIYITFGDEKYKKTRDFSAKMAKIVGNFDRVIAYGPEDIDNDFKQKHADIFRISRGYGLWLWKPYLIYKTLMKECDAGDLLFYGDGGSFFIRSVRHIELSMGGDDIWVTHNSLLEWQFTKREAFELMGCQGERFEKTQQAQGGFLLIRKTEKSVAFIKEWLNLCCDIRLLHPDNIFSNAQNPSGFRAHREDQSVLSLLCKKNGIDLHQDPTQYGKYPEKYWQKGVFLQKTSTEKEYPVCVLLHRTPTLNILTILRQYCLVLLPRCMGLRMISYVK